jgi:hypothetical protein
MRKEPPERQVPAPAGRLLLCAISRSRRPRPATAALRQKEQRRRQQTRARRLLLPDIGSHASALSREYPREQEGRCRPAPDQRPARRHERYRRDRAGAGRWRASSCSALSRAWQECLGTPDESREQGCHVCPQTVDVGTDRGPAVKCYGDRAQRAEELAPRSWDGSSTTIRAWKAMRWR